MGEGCIPSPCYGHRKLETMRKNTHTEAQATVGGEIPGGFFMARQAVIAGGGKFCLVETASRENCILFRNIFICNYGGFRLIP